MRTWAFPGEVGHHGRLGSRRGTKERLGPGEQRLDLETWWFIHRSRKDYIDYMPQVQAGR